jgi:hypothetical protein
MFSAKISGGFGPFSAACILTQLKVPNTWHRVQDAKYHPINASLAMALTAALAVGRLCTLLGHLLPE